MNVTSETLFHFTDSRLNLEKILSERFKISYCKENFNLGESSGSFYFPMISFCDLPLGSVKSHIKKYGNYAIGMTKNWGIRNKLNPVLYLETNSNITKDISILFGSITGIIDSLGGLLEDVVTKGNVSHIKNIAENTKTVFNSHNNLFRYIKNYQSDLTRGNKTYSAYRFYDEREWRFVPDIEDKNIKYSLTESEYKKFRGTRKTKKLLEKPILDFKAEDIKYLIVKSDKDISPLIRKINSIKHLCATPDQADILITKIFTVEVLESDF